MGAFVQDPKVESTDLVEKLDWTDLEKAALPDDLKKMIDSAVAWMKKNASAEGAPKDEILAAAALLSKVASGKFPGAAPKEKVDDKDKDKDKDKEDKKKSLLSVLDDGSLEIGGEPVEKGKSQFTSQRVESLKSALTPLFSVYAQVDAEGAKEMVQAIVKDTLSGEVKWAEKRVQDSVDLSEQIKKAMQPVLDGLTEIGKRVDSIEGTRPAPQSEPGDGDTTVKKSDNVWDGLPVG